MERGRTISSGEVRFATGASEEIGLGHLKRCLNLAAALAELGVPCRFVVHGSPDARALVQGVGLPVEPAVDAAATMASAGGEVIVVDSYDVTPADLEAVRAEAAAVVVFDDLAVAPLDVDVVINGAAGAERLPYALGPATVGLLGSRYAVVAPRLAGMAERVAGGSRVLISLGGGHHGTALATTLAAAVAARSPQASIDVVTGVTGPDPDAGLPEVRWHHSLPDLAPLLEAADVVVCSGGQTSYEALAARRPAVVVAMAANQGPSIAALASAGAVVAAGAADDEAVAATVAESVAALIEAPEDGDRLVAVGRHLVDGLGARRVAEEVRALVLRSGVPTAEESR